MLVAAEGWARTMTPASNYASRGPADPLGPEVEAIAGEMALAEARALLREHEPADGGTHHGAIYFNARTLTHGTALAQAQAALVGSLEAFVLCPALARGYGLSVYDCACGGCNNGRRA